jgi:hypothetical protein
VHIADWCELDALGGRLLLVHIADWCELDGRLLLVSDLSDMVCGWSA